MSDQSWQRAAGNPILSPVLAWEETAVVEPLVLYEGGTFKKWYRGGWDAEAIGYATCTGDPLVAANWTADPANPVYGGGGSGEAASHALPEVLKVGATYYLFCVKHPFGIGGTNVQAVATSADGIAWTTQAASMTLPSGKTLWGNSHVWQEGSTWYRLQEAGPTVWEIYLYTSADGLTWTIANAGDPLATLQRAAGGMYGGPFMLTPPIRPDGRYHLWYHAANVSGSLPTDIYHATSTDRITWTEVSASPSLTHLGSSFEVDQVADPCIVEAAGVTYLFYDGANNPAETSRIGVATFTSRALWQSVVSRSGAGTRNAAGTRASAGVRAAV